MSLPLPAPQAMGSWGQTNPTSYTAEQMQAYGQACREQALEEAAMAALEAPIKTHGQPLRQACANAIRSLK